MSEGCHASIASTPLNTPAFARYAFPYPDSSAGHPNKMIVPPVLVSIK